MPETFHAPVARHLFPHNVAARAIDTLLDILEEQGGRAVFRLDFQVVDAEGPDLVCESCHALLFREGEIRSVGSDGMEPRTRSAFGEVLIEINGDTGLAEAAEAYPLPWSDGSFSRPMKGRFLSVFLTRGGVGAVAQEYLPSFLGDLSISEYCGPDLHPGSRAEIMSVFTPPAESAHVSLAHAGALADRQDLFAAILALQCDGEVEVTLAEIDPGDALSGAGDP